jgi:glycosyltransferase involved in cell wall biosynthesis
MPRLPMTYGFLTPFLERGHEVRGVHLGDGEWSDASAWPFAKVYRRADLSAAIDAADIALLWGWSATRAMLRQASIWSFRSKVVLASFVWSPWTPAARKAIPLFAATRVSAYLGRAVVLMTAEQVAEARRWLPRSIPVIQFPCGVDAEFYAREGKMGDAPEEYHKVLERVFQRPFVMLSGDREDDAVEIARRARIRLVRVTRDPEKVRWYERQSACDGGDCYYAFRDIPYPMVRLLLQRATAYLGAVDCTWQPAGWTVACEALSSGCPVVLYDGLVARELRRRGAGAELVVVRNGSVPDAAQALARLAARPEGTFRRGALDFARAALAQDSTRESRFVEEVADLALPRRA